MKYRYLLPAALLLCALSACGSPEPDSSALPEASFAPPEAAAVLEIEPDSDRYETLRHYGELERLRADIPADAPVAVQALHFTISVQEVEALAEEYQISGAYDADTARSKALGQLIENRAVYTHAADQGFAVSEESLEAMIADRRDSADQVNPTDFAAFLEGFGTEEAYWSYQLETQRILQTKELFRADCREKAPELSDTEFAQHYAGVVADIITNENVTILDQD